MEVLLLQDLTGIGKKNDLLIVGDGYALNFLLPENKALVATPTVGNRYSDQIKRRAEVCEIEKALKASAAGAVSGKTVVFKKKATKTGKLYGAITEKHIAEAVLDQHKVELSTKDIVIDEQIKALGEFEVKVKHEDTEMPLSLKIEQEK